MEPVRIPYDEVRMQIFKKYTLTYHDIYGRKKTQTFTHVISDYKQVFSNAGLEQTANDPNWLTNVEKFKDFRVTYSEEGGARAVGTIIAVLLDLMEKNRIAGGEIAEGAVRIARALGVGVEYNEYKAEQTRKEQFEKAVDSRVKEAGKKKK